MGCCVSTPKNETIPKHLGHQNNNSQHFLCVSKSPPRAEEEAVKEVLSETPKPKPKPKPRPVSPVREILKEEEPTKSKLLLLTPKKPISNPKLPARNPDPCTPEEISEASEMRSFSESISTEEYNNNQLLSTKETASSVEPRQRVYRSQGYNGNYLKNQGRSPARRRVEPSPPRRKAPGQGVPRKETDGDNSKPRSQSPNVGRSPSGRRTGPSPGRVRMVHGLEDKKKMEEEVELKRESQEWEGPKESLENPLVSLECFIFL